MALSEIAWPRKATQPHAELLEADHLKAGVTYFQLTLLPEAAECH